MVDDGTRELPRTGPAQPTGAPTAPIAPAAAPAGAPAGVRGFLATRRGRTTGLATLGVLLLAAVVALTWGLTGGSHSPRNQDASSAAGVSTQATTPPAATSSAAPTAGSTAAGSAQTAATAAGPTAAAPAQTTGAAPAAGAGAAAPWCTADCTATTPQRAVELAVMALQANDLDAYRSVTIDMDPAELRSAMADGALAVGSCQSDSGDATCTATFGSTAFDVTVAQLPQDQDGPARDMPWGVESVQAH